MEQNNNTTKKWYTTWWAITLLVLGVAPVLLTGLVLFVAIIIGISQAPSNKTERDQSNSTKTISPPAVPEKPKDPDTLNVSVSHNGVYISFVNNESKDFSSCTFRLNQDYEYMSGKAYSLASTKTADLSFADFTKDDGSRFNIFAVKPQYLSAQCSRKDGDSGFADIFWD